MMSVLFNPMVASGMEPNVAWRVAMVVPAVMFVVCAICMKLMMPGRFKIHSALLYLNFFDDLGI